MSYVFFFAYRGHSDAPTRRAFPSMYFPPKGYATHSAPNSHYVK